MEEVISPKVSAITSTPISATTPHAGIHTIAQNVQENTHQNFASSKRTNSINLNSSLCDINYKLLYSLLEGYDFFRRKFLYLGLSQGFRIHFKGIMKSRFAVSHASALSNPTKVKEKLQKELFKDRIAGPFTSPPFDPMIFSPIGLVPKKEPGKFRLIHNLSFPKEDSINSNIPKLFTFVSYENLDIIVDFVVKCGKGALLAKADIESAFRILPIHPNDYLLLGFQWENQFYFDKRLPMGASTSCQNFEEFSKALQWILKNKFSVDMVSHILDDFMFCGPPSSNACRSSLEKLILLCDIINVPLNKEKTVLPCTKVPMHGIEIDTMDMVARLPVDKLSKAKSLINSLLNKRKTQLKELQQALGFLNFACRVIKPGRAFLHRLIDATMNVPEPYFHI